MWDQLGENWGNRGPINKISSYRYSVPLTSGAANVEYKKTPMADIANS